MASVRLWILAVALGSFAAGMVVGFAIPELLAADVASASPEHDYARSLAQRYGLDSAQQRRLLLVLQEDRRLELEILKSAEWSQLPASLRNEWLAVQRRTEQRIRYVLDDAQRALYDRDSRPIGGGAPAAGDQSNR